MSATPRATWARWSLPTAWWSTARDTPISPGSARRGTRRPPPTASPRSPCTIRRRAWPSASPWGRPRQRWWDRRRPTITRATTATPAAPPRATTRMAATAAPTRKERGATTRIAPAWASRRAATTRTTARAPAEATRPTAATIPLRAMRSKAILAASQRPAGPRETWPEKRPTTPRPAAMPIAPTSRRPARADHR